MQAPSTSLLRAFLKPPICCSRQIRQASNRQPATGYVDPKKYHKLNALDKLHRRQKEAVRKEKSSSYERADSMEPPISFESLPVEQTLPDAPQAAAALPYTISRTPSRNLPVYHFAKAGGNKHLTTVRKLTGDLNAMQSDIRQALGLEQFVVDQQGRKKENVAINWTTKQIVVRGWRGPEIKKWAELRGF